MPVQYAESSDDPTFDPGADIVGIGDSWFFFPKNNLLEALDRALGRRLTIQAYGDNGLRIVDYFEPTLAGFWRRALRSMALRTKALLISGGGNDFAGEDDFRTLIREDCSGAAGLDACWRPGQPQALFDRVEQGYRDLIRDARRAGFDGTVFVHAYDYAVPTGVGFNRFIGGWLKKPMDTSNVPVALHRPLVRALVDELERRLRGLAASDAAVVFVDSTGVLRENEWHDELHPTRAGFDRLAQECWLPEVAALFPPPAVPVRRAKRPTRAKAPSAPARTAARRAKAPAKAKVTAKAKVPAKAKAKAPAKRKVAKAPASRKAAKAPAKRKVAKAPAAKRARAPAKRSAAAKRGKPAKAKSPAKRRAPAKRR